MAKRNFLIILPLAFLLFFLLALAPLTVKAAEEGSGCQPPKDYQPGGLLREIDAQCAYCGDCQLNDFLQVGANVFNLILGVVGSLMLLMFFYGGLNFLSSGGSAEKIATGKKFLVNALIGGIIVFVAFTMVNMLMARLTTGSEFGAVQIEQEK